MFRIITVFYMVLQTSTLFAQTPVDSVKQVVNNLFLAMQNADTFLLKSCFADGAILQTINKKAGIAEVKSETLSAFINSIGTQQKGTLDERITFETVNIDDDLAIAWTAYSFYYKGTFSHCGVNSFQLVRINGTWKIQYLIDTRRKSGCK